MLKSGIGLRILRVFGLTIVMTLWLGSFSIPGFVAASAGGNGTELILQDSPLTYSINAQMDVLEDDQNEWSYEDVLSPNLQEQFHPAVGRSSFGYTSSTYWARIVVHNESASNKWEISLANPLMDHMDMYTSVKYVSVERHNPTFFLDLPPGEDSTIYLRFQSSGPMIIPLRIAEQSTLYESTRTEFLMYGLYYGMILIIIVYMFSIYRSTYNSAFFYYIFYILCYSMAQFMWNGLARQFFGINRFTAGAEGVYFFGSPESIYDFFFLLSLWFGFIAIRKILELPKYVPFLDKVCRLMIAICPIFVISTTLFYSHEIPLYISWFKFVAIIMVPTFIVWCALSGNRIAWYISIAIVPLIVIGGPSILLSFGLLPDNVFTHFGMQIGSAAEFLIMAIVLYDQVRQMRKKQEKAQVELVQALADWNVALKKTVAEQTESLKRTNDELVVTEVSRTELLQNITHDVRSPLHYVQGGIQALKNSLVTKPEQQEEILEKIYDKVLDVNHFIDNVMKLSRFEVGSDALQAVIFDEWIEEILQEQAADIEYSGHCCEILQPLVDEDIDVMMDPHAIRRAITNIVQNACKFTPKSGTITLQVFLKGKFVTLMVGDTGEGIEPEKLAHIFLRYYKNGKAQGSGLGLAIAKEIVKQHSGEIWVESELGQGSRFYISLPIMTSNARALQQ